MNEIVCPQCHSHDEYNETESGHSKCTNCECVIFVGKKPTRNGGPAFPETCNGMIIPGMTLRDYFAAKAMQSLIQKLPSFDQIGEYGNKIDDDAMIKLKNDVAESSYRYADAMLKEKNK